MKTVLVAIHALFALLLGATVYLAAVSDEGLVDDGYFERATRYLADREMEREMGLTVRLPGRLEAGRNNIAAVVATTSGPLRGAAAVLHAMRLSGPREDATARLREEAPGTYAGDLLLPGAGEWLLRLTVDRGALRAERRWFATAAARDGGGAGARAGHAGGDIHAGPVAGLAGRQRVILDISPKPVRAMRELLFAVELPGADGVRGTPRIDLEMPGMRMPPNRVELRRDADGIWRGKGVIVRCGSGRRTWSAAVTLSGESRAVFTFDVAE